LGDEGDDFLSHVAQATDNAVLRAMDDDLRWSAVTGK